MSDGTGGEARSEVTRSVALVDDDAIVRAWIRISLRGSEFRVVGEAQTGDETLGLLDRRRPDLLLVDYRLPDVRATDVVREIRRAGWNVPVLVITAAPEPGLNEAVVEAGAQGVVLKRGDPEELLHAMRLVFEGERVVDTAHPRRPVGQRPLSRRERELLRLAAAGSTNREIASVMGVGSETVKTMLSRTFSKLGVRNRTEAVAVAKERGLL